VAALASLCDGQAILYAVNAQAPSIVAHRAAQGRAVLFNAKGQVVLATGSTDVALTTVTHLTGRRKADGGERLLPSILAAVGAAWALDISPDLIAAGLKTFEIELPTARLAQAAH
jgi:cyanophycin synthetase